MDGKPPKTPPSKIDSGVVRDKSDRFSSSDKKQKQDQKYARALGLLKGDMVKRKLHFDREEERKNEGQPKRKTRSVTVRYLFGFLSIFDPRPVTRDLQLNETIIKNSLLDLFFSTTKILKELLHQEHGLSILTLYEKA